MNPALLAAILPATIPTLMVGLGIVLSRIDIHHLRDELRRKIAELRTQQHSDMLRIYELFGEHGERIVRLETKILGR